MFGNSSELFGSSSQTFRNSSGDFINRSGILTETSNKEAEATPKVLYIKMNIKEQKTELNKKDIYENVRKDINRKQTVHSNKSATYRSGTPEMPDRRKKVYSSYDHYYHNDSNTARMPTHNHHLYLKRLLEYHNTEHDYKVLRVKQRMKEENEMLQNEMTSLREVRKNHRLEDYGANVQNMKQRIDEYKQWLRGDTQD